MGSAPVADADDTAQREQLVHRPDDPFLPPGIVA